MDMMFTCCNHLFFSFQLLCTHMFRVYVLMFVLEGELKSHAHAFVFYVCVSSKLGDGSS
jgi:hypothetical protein